MIVIRFFFFPFSQVGEDGKTHHLAIGLSKKEEILDLFKSIDMTIRDVKLKQTTLKRSEKRETKTSDGHSGSGGSSIGRAIGKVLHRKSKSEVKKKENGSCFLNIFHSA